MVTIEARVAAIEQANKSVESLEVYLQSYLTKKSEQEAKF